MAKENVQKRRGLVQDIKRAYKGQTEFRQYAEINLFQEPCTQLCKTDTLHLDKWIRRYKMMLLQTQGTAIETQRRDMLEVNEPTPVGDRNVAHRAAFYIQFSSSLYYCAECWEGENVSG